MVRPTRIGWTFGKGQSENRKHGMPDGTRVTKASEVVAGYHSHFSGFHCGRSRDWGLIVPHHPSAGLVSGWSPNPVAPDGRERRAGRSQSGGVGAIRPAGRGDMAPERAGTERPERRVETLAPTERFMRGRGTARVRTPVWPARSLAVACRAGCARCAARATPPSPRGKKEEPPRSGRNNPGTEGQTAGPLPFAEVPLVE